MANALPTTTSANPPERALSTSATAPMAAMPQPISAQPLRPPGVSILAAIAPAFCPVSGRSLGGLPCRVQPLALSEQGIQRRHHFPAGSRDDLRQFLHVCAPPWVIKPVREGGLRLANRLLRETEQYREREEFGRLRLGTHAGQQGPFVVCDHRGVKEFTTRAVP